MKRSFVAGLLLAATAIPASALADQCAWIGKEQARDALHFAEKGLRFFDYCEPCGDELANVEISTIEKVEKRGAKNGVSLEIHINGEAKDLAYVFVETVAGSNEYENLAGLARCQAEGVSDRLTVEAKASVKHHPKKH